MNPTRPPDATATVAVRVDAAPAVAFAAFTEDLDQWWRRGPKYRHAGHAGTIHLEPWVGGTLYESWHDATGAHRFTLGTVLAFEPGRHLRFSWRNATFAPTESTEVDVTFTAAGDGTLVTVRHFGWEALRPDHPARHGQDDRELARAVGMWWAEQCHALRARLQPPTA